jgi:hypothetical protein
VLWAGEHNAAEDDPTWTLHALHVSEPSFFDERLLERILIFLTDWRAPRHPAAFAAALNQLTLCRYCITTISC